MTAADSFWICREREGNRVGRELCFGLSALGCAATLRPLLLVHRLVSLFEYLFETGHALRFERRDTDTERELVTTSVARVVGSQIFIESRDRVFFTRVQIGNEHGELVAAETCDDVRATKTAIENRGSLDERVVAFVMSKLVVDL